MKVKHILYTVVIVLAFFVVYTPDNVEAAVCVCDVNSSPSGEKTCFGKGTTVTGNILVLDDNPARLEPNSLVVQSSSNCMTDMRAFVLNVNDPQGTGDVIRLYETCNWKEEYANCDYYEKGDKTEMKECKCKKKVVKGSESDTACLKVYTTDCKSYPNSLEGVDYVSCEEVPSGTTCDGGALGTTASGTTEMVLPSGIRELNQLGSKDLKTIIGEGIKVVMGILGSIALMMFVYAGALWMTAAGNAEHEKKAMQILVWSSLGVIVILSSYTIVDFVLEAFK